MLARGKDGRGTCAIPASIEEIEAMTYAGACRCGAITWHAEGEPIHSSLCHCTDCTRSAGAPMVGWALFRQQDVTITGNPTDYHSTPGTIRRFCGTCGTGLFYLNEALFPGQVDIQSSTADDRDALAPHARIQVADAPGWFSRFAGLPQFDRFPPG